MPDSSNATEAAKFAEMLRRKCFVSVQLTTSTDPGVPLSNVQAVGQLLAEAASTADDHRIYFHHDVGNAIIVGSKAELEAHLGKEPWPLGFDSGEGYRYIHRVQIQDDGLKLDIRDSGHGQTEHPNISLEEADSLLYGMTAYGYER